MSTLKEELLRSAESAIKKDKELLKQAKGMTDKELRRRLRAVLLDSLAPEEETKQVKKPKRRKRKKRQVESSSSEEESSTEEEESE